MSSNKKVILGILIVIIVGVAAYFIGKSGISGTASVYNSTIATAPSTIVNSNTQTDQNPQKQLCILTGGTWETTGTVHWCNWAEMTSAQTNKDLLILSGTTGPTNPTSPLGGSPSTIANPTGGYVPGALWYSDYSNCNHQGTKVGWSASQGQWVCESTINAATQSKSTQ